LQKRKALSDQEFDQLNKHLLKEFSKLDFSGMETIHVFLPIENKREPDTFLLINWLKDTYPQTRIVVPKADFNTFIMTHHEYMGAEDLERNLFNILEPMQAKQYTGAIDIVLVPLLGFDLSGNRVGYGKGFYDRFLQELPGAKKIGISLFPPIDKIEDTDGHDVLLDGCITPEKIYTF
ncbi:MAG: 5-formyltetrahydrofolate cyclo-ligase, partial [Chitinophagaceae bacterium]